MTKAALRVGIIGLGVGERHIAGYEADPRCAVTALCDSDPAKLAEVAARHPGRALTTDALALLDDPQIDAVSIASYDDAHYSQILRAFGKGKHVFVEKPLCLYRNELDGIRAEWEKAGGRLRLSSNLILRKSPRFVRLRERLRGGELGTPYYMEAEYNYGRAWKITEGWRGKIPFYSVVHGGAIHLIDLLLWLTGKKIVEAQAFGNHIATAGTAFRHNDLVAALLRFDDGAIAKVSANFGSMIPHIHALAVHGTVGSFVQGLDGRALLFHSRDPNVAPQVDDTAYPGAAKGDMLPAFVKSILDGGDPEVSEREVFAAMFVSLAIEEASRQNSTVKVQP